MLQLYKMARYNKRWLFFFLVWKPAPFLVCYDVEGNGHMQTPHQFDVFVQEKMNWDNEETFHSENYARGTWHTSCTVNGSFPRV